MKSQPAQHPAPITAALQSRAGGAWGDCISLWLASRQAPETARAYARALQNLLTSCPAPIDQISHTDVLRWRLGLEAEGMARSTIALYLAAVSSFYLFAMTEYYLGGRPLAEYNPAAGRSLRPSVERFGKAAWLEADEARALLGAIDRETVQGRRDYALFLGYLLMARRNSEWRQACWGDFIHRGDVVTMTWSGKGKRDQRLIVPPPVWSALGEYLQAAGRDQLAADDHMFTSVHHRHVQPLSAVHVRRLLVGYLERAGLSETGVTVHSLRHTGATLRMQAGASERELNEFLKHSSRETTEIYLHAVRRQTDERWQRVAEMLGIS